MSVVGFNEWKSKNYDVGGMPVEFLKDENCLKIAVKDNYYSVGQWTGKLADVNVNKKYFISVDYKAESNNYKVIAVLHQMNIKGETIASDYLIDNNEGRFEISIEISSNCNFMRLVLAFSSYGEGNCIFSNPQVEISEKTPHRIINVATSYFERKWYEKCDDNIPHILKIIENAAKDENKPHILCFTETTYDRGILAPFAEKCTDENSDIMKLMREKAKEYDMYFVFGIHEKDDGRMYNSAYIISSEGDIVGKYRKTHFTYGEILSPMTPGDEIPVFDLPFGKVGLMICWDQWYPEMARKLSEKGAEIIFVLTAGNPECLSRARAYENGVFVVVSGCEDNNPKASFVVDQYGEIIGAVESEEKGYVSVPLDLDGHKYLQYLSFPWGYGGNIFKNENRKDLYKK